MILVTGGTGFIGSHLLDALAGSAEPVRCIVRRKLRTRVLPAGVETVPGDFQSGEGLADALRGVDTVIHLAGVTKALSTGEYYSGNAEATRTLARAVSGRPVRFVHVSSLAAIGPSIDGSPVAVDAEPHPISNYGRSKLEAERIVRELLPEAVIVRPPAVYGPRDTDIYQMLKSISKGLVLEISGGERWISLIYVQDLVEGILLAARHPAAVANSYYLTHSKPVSWSELGAAAARIMNRRPRHVRVPLPAAYAAGWCAELWSGITGKPGIISREKVAEAKCLCWTCDPGPAEEQLGFQARTSLDDGLARTLAWYKEAGWLKY